VFALNAFGWLAFGILQTRIVNFLLPKCRDQIVSIVFKIKFLFGILGSSIDRASHTTVHPSISSPQDIMVVRFFKKKIRTLVTPLEYQTIFGIS
jgi:hypothetical protein